MDDSNYPVGGGTAQGSSSAVNTQASAQRSQALKNQAQQLSESSSSGRDAEDSEQQSASTQNSELNSQANAAHQALSAPLTRAKNYLSGSNYAVAGYTAPSKGVGQ
jgi:hypothetical protein